MSTETTETVTAVSQPPEELHQLDFLLGHNKSVGETPPDGSPATVMYMYGEPTLGGHYYNVDVSWPGTMAGRWIFGWNPVDEEFNVYYIADSGSQGTATSAGWVEGEFVVTGSYTVAERNAHKIVRDVFAKADADGNFVTRSFVQSAAGDKWIPIDVFHSHPISAEQASEENPGAHY